MIFKLFWTLAYQSVIGKRWLAQIFDSREILESVWEEEENFEVLKRWYIQIYATSFLLY